MVNALVGCFKSNNGHSGVSVACPTTDIIFLFRGNARHSTVCYNEEMAQETLDLPSWLEGAATCELRWDFPEEEGMMQYSIDMYFP